MWSGMTKADETNLTCVMVGDKSNAKFNLDLKNKIYKNDGITIPIAFTDQTIIFQTYLPKVIVYSVIIDRKNKKGTMYSFDYIKFEKDIKTKPEVHIEKAHTIARYPELSEDDKVLFTTHSYLRKYFTPINELKLDCSK